MISNADTLSLSIAQRRNVYLQSAAYIYGQAAFRLKMGVQPPGTARLAVGRGGQVGRLHDARQCLHDRTIDGHEQLFDFAKLPILRQRLQVGRPVRWQFL